MVVVVARQATHATPKGWRQAFLAALREQGNVRFACEVAGVERSTAYRLREKDTAFATAWESALDDAVESLEQVAWERAKETSDTLLIFLLKAHRPAKYRETTKHEHSGPQGQPIALQFFDANAAIDALTGGSAEDC